MSLRHSFPNFGDPDSDPTVQMHDGGGRSVWRGPQRGFVRQIGSRPQPAKPMTSSAVDWRATFPNSGIRGEQPETAPASPVAAFREQFAANRPATPQTPPTANPRASAPPVTTLPQGSYPTGNLKGTANTPFGTVSVKYAQPSKPTPKIDPLANPSPALAHNDIPTTPPPTVAPSPAIDKTPAPIQNTPPPTPPVTKQNPNPATRIEPEPTHAEWVDEQNRQPERINYHKNPARDPLDTGRIKAFGQSFFQPQNYPARPAIRPFQAENYGNFETNPLVLGLKRIGDVAKAPWYRNPKRINPLSP